VTLCYICGVPLENLLQEENICKNCQSASFELQKLLIHAQKELGEIAECAIKQDRPGHWKNELGDLCGLCITPMLELAGIDFETACRIGIERKKQKIAEKLNSHR
jgi:hypothetical protein